MRNNSYNFEAYNHLFGVDLRDTGIHDAGDLEVAQNIDDTLDMISVHADNYVNDGKIPVMLGGEHSLTLRIIDSAYASALSSL